MESHSSTLVHICSSLFGTESTPQFLTTIPQTRSSIWLDLLIILLLVLINGFFSASEMAIVTLNGNKIRKDAESGSKTAQALVNFIEKKSNMLATIQVAITFAGFLSSAFGASKLAPVLYKYLDPQGIRPYLLNASTILITLILSILSLVFGELVPKRIGLANPERFSRKAAALLRFFDVILRPFAVILDFLSSIICRLIGLPSVSDADKVSEEEIRLLAAVGGDSGGIRMAEAEMIENIFELDDKAISEIMTPRTAMVTLPADATYEETLEVAAREKYSRIPVYEEDIDDIIGVLFIKDLLMISDGEKADFDLRKYLRNSYFVPETKSVNLVIREMQSKSVSLAIVVDEYGGTDGMVTVEDILEEIVGEIIDEYDDHDRDIVVDSDGNFLVNGLLSPEEVGRTVEELDEIEDDDSFDTIAGFVLSLLEHIPEPDEHPSVEFKNLRFTVLEMDDRRIAKIKIERLEQAAIDLEEERNHEDE